MTSQKGGSGKTRLAHLAVEIERACDGPAWLIDTDKRGTLSLWHERREAETPQRANVLTWQANKIIRRVKSAERKAVELTRFSGHLIVRFGGVRYGGQDDPVHAGV